MTFEAITDDDENGYQITTTAPCRVSVATRPDGSVVVVVDDDSRQYVVIGVDGEQATATRPNLLTVEEANLGDEDESLLLQEVDK